MDRDWQVSSQDVRHYVWHPDIHGVHVALFIQIPQLPTGWAEKQAKKLAKKLNKKNRKGMKVAQEQGDKAAKWGINRPFNPSDLKTKEECVKTLETLNVCMETLETLNACVNEKYERSHGNHPPKKDYHLPPNQQR